MMSILFGVQSFECSAQRVSVATQQQRGRQLSHNPIEQQSRERYQALLDRTEQVLSELQQDQRLQGVGKVSYSKRALRLLAIAVVKIIEETWGASKFLAKQTIKLAFSMIKIILSNPLTAVPVSFYVISKLGLSEKVGKMIVDAGCSFAGEAVKGLVSGGLGLFSGGWEKLKSVF